MAKLLSCITLILVLKICRAVWIGEEYWATVTYDGTLLDGRTSADFLTFDAVHHNIPMVNAYIAFWITYDEQGHYETFGHAFLDVNGICARFVDRHGQNKRLCGGFRVLSTSNAVGPSKSFKFVPAENANIHRAIGYRGQQIAKVVSWQKNEAWYGSAKLSDRTAEGIDYEGSRVQLSYQEDPYFYNNYVFVLVKVDEPQPHVPQPPYESFYHTPEEEYRQQQQQQRQQQQQQQQQQQYDQQQDQQQQQQQQHDQPLQHDQQQQHHDQQQQQHTHHHQHHQQQEQRHHNQQEHQRLQKYHRQQQQQQQHHQEQQEQLQQQQQQREHHEHHQQQQDDVDLGEDINIDDNWKFYRSNR